MSNLSQRNNYEKEFYELDLIFRSKKYRKLIKEMRSYYRKNGYPFPQSGFKTLKERNRWINKLHSAGMIEPNIMDIIEDFNLDKDNHKYFGGIRFKIYFDKDPKTITKMSLYQPDYVNKQFNILFEKRVTKDSWMKLWKDVSIFQEEIHPTRSRTKGYTEHEKYRDIYLFYLKHETKLLSRQDRQDRKYKKVIHSMKQDPDYGDLKSKYNLLEQDDLYKIINICKERYGHINLR